MPGIDSLKKGHEKAVQEGLKNIHLLKGTHIETVHTNEDGRDMPFLTLTEPMIVSGDGRENTFVEGNGFCLEGKKNLNCTFMDLTIRKTKTSGLFGRLGMSFLCIRVGFDQCGGSGVVAYKTKGRLMNCRVTNCEYSGVYGYDGSTIEVEGEETRIQNNCTTCTNKGNSEDYGLNTKSDAIIQLLSPLTKEEVSKNNSGGGNYGGQGMIVTVNAFDITPASSAGETKEELLSSSVRVFFCVSDMFSFV